MGETKKTLWDKINLLLSSLNDIQAAINEKKVEVDSTVPLSKYGDKIREIQTDSGWKDYITMEAYPAFTEDDLVVCDMEDVTDDVILGNIEGLKSRDYITATATWAFTEEDLVAKDMEDVTETMTIIENTYTD